MKSKRYLAGLGIVGAVLMASGCGGGGGLQFQPFIPAAAPAVTEVVFTANAVSNSLSALGVIGETLQPAVTFPTQTVAGGLQGDEISALSLQPVVLTIEGNNGGFPTNVGAYQSDGNGNLTFMSDQTSTLGTTFGDGANVEPGPVFQTVIGANTVAYFQDVKSAKLAAFTVSEGGATMGNLTQLGNVTTQTTADFVSNMALATAGGNNFLLTIENGYEIESWLLNADGSLPAADSSFLSIPTVGSFGSTGIAVFTSGGQTFVLQTGDATNGSNNVVSLTLDSNGAVALNSGGTGTSGVTILGDSGTATAVGVVVEPVNGGLQAIVTSSDGTETAVPLNADGTFGTPLPGVVPGSLITGVFTVGSTIASAADPNLQFLVVGTNEDDLLVPVSTASGSVTFGTPVDTGAAGATTNSPFVNGSAFVP